MDIPIHLYSFDNLFHPGYIFDLGIQAQYGFVCRLICKIFSGRNIAMTVLGTIGFLRLWCRKMRHTKKVFCIQNSKKSSHLFDNYFGKEFPEYALQSIDHRDSLKPDSQVLVVCYASARLKDEIDTSLENISYKGKLMLIIIHSCEPTQRPTKILDRCSDRRVKSFTTLLIWNGVFYPCPTNKDARRTIMFYLKRK
ncbi:uncharacterized protein LOC134234434 [Saccostrea cucullata]|uniref:uncharacterized protein LOC134234434 n=1 Tax=Saccostrea cuccullata TaxID=36930 RepID=UPI002ED44BA8